MLLCEFERGGANWEDTARIDRIRRAHAQKHVSGVKLGPKMIKHRNLGTANSFRVGLVCTTRTTKSMANYTSISVHFVCHKAIFKAMLKKDVYFVLKRTVQKRAVLPKLMGGATMPSFVIMCVQLMILKSVWQSLGRWNLCTAKRSRSDREKVRICLLDNFLLCSIAKNASPQR